MKLIMWKCGKAADDLRARSFSPCREIVCQESRPDVFCLPGRDVVSAGQGVALGIGEGAIWEVYDDDTSGDPNLDMGRSAGRWIGMAAGLLKTAGKGILKGGIKLMAGEGDDVLKLAKAAIKSLGAGSAKRELRADIASEVKRFSKQKLGEQKDQFRKLWKTYEDHLKKYGQKPFETTGEVNRIEEQVMEYWRILSERGIAPEDLL